MPYINEQARRDMLAGIPPKTPGDLNYIFCMMTLGKLGQKSFPKHDWTPTFFHMMKQYVDVNGLNYQHINDVMGAAVSAVREIARRTDNDFLFARDSLLAAVNQFYDEIAIPYEDTKITENGDVF